MEASLIPKRRLEFLEALAHSVLLVPGAIAEVGVYRGGSAEVLARAMPDRELHLFDSFEGLPKPGPEDGAHCDEGRFRGTVAEVRRRVPNAIIHVMKLHHWSTVPAGPYAFVHIDVDQHRSTLAALMVFYPLVLPGGVIMVDDYGGQPTPGATKAVDQFMANAPEKLIRPHCGGGWFRRL